MTSYVFCNQCGHRNPPDSGFCSSCGAVLDRIEDHTITIGKIDPLQDAAGSEDDAVVNVADLPEGVPTLIVRSGPQAGDTLTLDDRVTRLGRHPDSEIMLEDITVSLRHSRIHAKDCEDCETKAGMLDRIDVQIELSGPLTPEQHAQLMAIAAKCPVHRTLKSEIDIRLNQGAAAP